jgi:hypothetical protein
LASIFADDPGTDMHDLRGAGAASMRADYASAANAGSAMRVATFLALVAPARGVWFRTRDISTF